MNSPLDEVNLYNFYDDTGSPEQDAKRILGSPIRYRRFRQSSKMSEKAVENVLSRTNPFFSIR